MAKKQKNIHISTKFPKKFTNNNLRITTARKWISPSWKRIALLAENLHLRSSLFRTNIRTKRTHGSRKRTRVIITEQGDTNKGRARLHRCNVLHIFRPARTMEGYTRRWNNSSSTGGGRMREGAKMRGADDKCG